MLSSDQAMVVGKPVLPHTHSQSTSEFITSKSKTLGHAALVKAKLAVKCGAALAIHHPFVLGVVVSTALVAVPAYRIFKKQAFSLKRQEMLDHEYGVDVDHLEDATCDSPSTIESRRSRDPCHQWAETCKSWCRTLKRCFRVNTRRTNCRSEDATTCTTMVVYVAPATPWPCQEAPAIVAPTPLPGTVVSDATCIIRGCGDLDLTRPTVTRHRRIRRGCRNKYANCVIKEVKLRFGVPTRTEANLKAVSNYAESIMSRRGLRPSHAAAVLPLVVTWSFIPSKAELSAISLLGSIPVRSRTAEYTAYKSAAGFKNAA